MRSRGSEKGGEFSVENLAFKALRRSPFIATISKMKVDAYDKAMTMENGIVKEDVKMINFCEDIFDVYDDHSIDTHIPRPK